MGEPDNEKVETPKSSGESIPCSVDLVVGTLGVLPTTAEARALDKLLVAGLRLTEADRPRENDDRLLVDRPLSSLMKVAYTFILRLS